MNREFKIKVLVLLGPTASGKSDLAVGLAKKIGRRHIGGYLGAEILSADSRQVYSGMNIATGKITKKEMRGVPHHLLNVVNPQKQFTVIEFKKRAEQAIAEIASHGNLPIICGGTGFYIDSLINGKEFPIVAENNKLRKQLANKSVAELFNILQKLDHDRACKMNSSDNKNPRRLVRAIEIAVALEARSEIEMLERKQNQIALAKLMMSAERTCDDLTSLQSESFRLSLQHNHNYDPLLIGLKVPAVQLRDRIHTRLLKRIKTGMLNEARRLHRPVSKGGANLSWKRMEELGLEYRYMARHLQGKISEGEMAVQLETEIWHYAKRQMTWFKRDKRIKWFDPKQTGKIEMFVRMNLA